MYYSVFQYKHTHTRAQKHTVDMNVLVQPSKQKILQINPRMLLCIFMA